MAVVLLILTIIGIVAIVLILCILAVLLLPIVYEADADFDHRHVTVRMRWLFRLIGFRFSYADDIDCRLRIVFFTIDFFDESRIKKRALKKEKKNKKKPEKEKPPLASRVSSAVATAKHMLTAFCDNDVWDAIFPGLQIFLCRLRPRLLGSVSFGLDDPSLTGTIAGGLSLLPFLYDTDLTVMPDFEAEQVYIRGQLRANGRLRLVWVLLLLLRWMRQSDFRRFFNAVRTPAS